MTYRTICNRCERYALIGHANRRWYRVARAVILRLSQKNQTDYYRAGNIMLPDNLLCDLVAITSPRCFVKRNLLLAWGEFTGQPRPSDMIRSTRVALDHYYATGTIRGAKTSRFAKVLRGDDSVVVVDTWMARALGVRDKQARNKSTQELAERVIGTVQRRLCFSHGVYTRPLPEPGLCSVLVVRWPLAEVQAAVWAGMIRTYYKNGKIPMYRTEDVGLYRTGPNGTLSDVPF